MKLPSALRALAYRNYRLFFFGQGISLIGTWMQQIALSWLVFTMTGSSLQLGLVLFCGQIPTLLLSPLVGVMMEGWNRRKVLMVTQCVALTQALLLTLLTLTDSVTLSIIWPLSLLLGVVTTFDVNARQSFISVMVEKREDMVNAIALNSSLVNSARLIGPALAAFVLAHSNAATCFGINSLSYLAVICSLWAMRGVSAAPAAVVKTPLLKSLNEGFTYVKDFVPFRVVLLNLSVASMAGAAYNVMLPEFSVHVLGGDASTLALLSSANGLGALAAAVMLAMRKKMVGLSRWIIAGNSMMGVGAGGLQFHFHPELGNVCLVFYRLWVDGAGGFDQYLPADDRRPSQAGAGDEFLYFEFPGHGAVGQPAFRLSHRAAGAWHEL